MTLRRLLAPALALSAAAAAGGCGALSEDAAGGSADGSRVVAVALYPVEYVAERVAGDGFEVENLVQAGGEPHDLELGVRETALVADSALLVYVDSLQPAVDDAVDQASGRVLDAAEVVDLQPFVEHTVEEHTEEGHEEEGHEEEGHAEEGHEEEAHEHGELDPHFWQDPVRMADLGDAVAAELAEIDPDGAEDYRANAEALRADLEALDREYADGLASCQVDTVVTNHNAFGYLEKYGVHLEAIAGISPDAEPTPAALARLQELIADEGVTTVFSESLVSPKTAQTLARDAGVGTAVLDTVEGLTDETADEDYLSLMRQNLAALQQANRC